MTTYKELDYIKSTGTQYVVSPVQFYGDNYKIECKFDNSDTPTDTTPFGYQDTGSGVQIMVVGFNNSNSAGTLFWNGTSTAHANRAKQNVMTKGLNELVIEANNGTLTYTLNGESPVSYETNTSFSPQTGNMWIFGNNRQSISGSHQLVTMKFYYLRIYQNNVLLYDLIPVLDFNDTPAVYDKVNDVLYYNQGTGDFLYQRKGYYCEVEYLESTGTQYIDTGYIPTAKTSFDLFGVDMDYTTGMIRFGSRVDVINENYCFTTIASNDFRFTYGSGRTTTSIQYVYSTHKLAKKVSFNAATKICTITFNDDTTEPSTAFNTTPLTSAAQSIYLFAFNNSGTAVYGKSKQSGLKIYENGVLVRDYIPVLDWDMTPCFYDKITETKVYNLGTGQFNYGAIETRSGIQLRRKFNMLLASHKKQEYTPLKYLEGTGTGTYTSGQYIDTGLDYFADFEITAKQRESAGMKALATMTTYCIERENATTNAWRFRNGESTFFTTSLLVTELHTLKWKGGKVYGDGVELGSFAKTSNTGRMYLFAGSTLNAATRINRYPLQISSCRMWNPSTGELVRDYIPVLDKNGTPCMLDRVENKLYYNQGDGDFLYEEWDYTPCDCVYADGNAYTSMLWSGDSDTKMEMTFDITTAASGNTGTMGSRNTANSQLLAIGYGGTVLASDFNNSSYRPYRASITYELNKKYTVYTSKEKRSIVDEVTGTVLDENNTLCTDNMSTNVLLLGAETGISAKHNGNIYGAKVWEGATLIREYIPIVDGDNKAGFYDKCLNIISYSSGSSDFVGHFVENGVDYKVVKNIIAEQVETSTNTRACPYIDTGLCPATSKKTRLKCKASLAVATKSYEHYLGGTNAGSRFVIGQAGGSSGSKFYFGLGTQNYWTTQTVDTSLHIFGLDWATETCSIDDTTWQIPSAGTSESTKPFFINARNTANYANANRPAGGTSYWWKFWEGKKLVYNGIPVVRTSDDKVGLFETVNREFQTTAGTVEYTYTE